jgi:hypothetical protein
MKRLLVYLLPVLLIAQVAQAREVAGVDIPDTMDASGTQLALNGAGIRKKMFMNIYVGGLYLIKPDRDASRIIAADDPMAIRLHIVSGLVSSEAMEEATREGYEHSTGGNPGQFTDEIEAFIAVFKEPITEGDVFEIVHAPDEGLRIYKNGTFKGVVDGGLPFKKATFGIWLGEKPADSGLKKGMLKG